MKNKYVSILSLGLIASIVVQIIYFLNYESVDIGVPPTIELISLKTHRENSLLPSTVWLFSDGKILTDASSGLLRNNLKEESKIKEEKPILQLDNKVEEKQWIEPIVSRQVRHIRYLGMADSPDKLSFFFEIDGAYVSLKLNDIYNNLKLSSVTDNNVVLVDLTSDSEYSISK